MRLHCDTKSRKMKRASCFILTLFLITYIEWQPLWAPAMLEMANTSSTGCLGYSHSFWCDADCEIRPEGLNSVRGGKWETRGYTNKAVRYCVDRGKEQGGDMETLGGICFLTKKTQGKINLKRAVRKKLEGKKFTMKMPLKIYYREKDGTARPVGGNGTEQCCQSVSVGENQHQNQRPFELSQI